MRKLSSPQGANDISASDELRQACEVMSIGMVLRTTLPPDGSPLEIPLVGRRVQEEDPACVPPACVCRVYWKVQVVIPLQPEPVDRLAGIRVPDAWVEPVNGGAVAGIEVAEV